MDKEKEKKIIILALKKGLIEVEDLNIPEDISKNKTVGDSLIEFGLSIKFLVSKGLLKESDIAKLEKELELNEEIIVPQKEQSILKESTKKRYKIIKLLGEGGMGKVYKAHDTKLNRYVALKFLKENDPLKQKRLLNEAQAQAKLKSEAVCKIYEVGEMDGKPFISMQYIEGENLRDLSKEMSLEMKLNLIKKVAEALQEAHKLGILHRDINPSNIMIEKDEKGQPKPYILDFGLAKEVAEPGITQEGLIMGTLFYMSPEQARGLSSNMDRRSDIYSVGATLYEILTSRPPFTGGFSEVLDKICNQEPDPLTRINPSIPKDVESIVNKCLEKDVNLRYDSAKALAEDIERFLNGETVLARRTTFFYYLYKKIKKNKVLFLTIAIALMTIMVFSGMWISEKINSRKRAQLMQKFGEEIKEIESIMRYSHMLPIHNNSIEKEIILDKIKMIQLKMKKIGKVGECPSYYAIGRAYMSLRDFRKSQTYFQIAYENKYREAEFLYNYGLVLGEIYQEELREVERIRNKEIREARKKEIEKKYRNPALNFIKESKVNFKEQSEYAEALILFYEKSYDFSLKKAERMAGKTPWFYEVYKLKGDIHSAIGKEKESEGDFDKASLEYDLSEKEYSMAKEIGRSDVSIYLAMANLMRMKLRLETERGKPGQEIFKRAREEIKNALIIDSENEKAYNLDSLICWTWANEQLKYGKDPVPFIDESIKSAEKAIQIRSDFALPYNNIGVANIIKADYLTNIGEDPLNSIQKSLENYEKAIELDSENVEVYINLGNAYTYMVDYLYNKGKEIDIYIQKAIKSYSHAEDILSNMPALYNNFGIIYQYKAENEINRGMDPAKSFEKAIEKHKKAIKLNPNYISALLNLGVDYAELAIYEKLKGKNPIEKLKQSNEYYIKAININPSYAKAYNNLGSNYFEMAKNEIETGRDPEKYFQLSLNSLKSAMEINPNSAYPYNDLGELYILKGKLNTLKGENPKNQLIKAMSFLEKALSIDKTWVSPYYNFSLLYLELANYKFLKKFDPLKELESSEKYIEKTVEMNSNYYKYYETFSSLLLLKAEYLLEKNAEISNLLDKANDFIDKGMEINPNYDGFYALKARHLYLKNKLDFKKNKYRAELENEIEGNFKKAINLNSSNLQNLEMYCQWKLFKLEIEIEKEKNLTESVQDGINLTEKMIEINPNYGNAYALKAIFEYYKTLMTNKEIEKQKHYKKAKDLLIKAFYLNKNLEKYYERFSKLIIY